ncbi:hypothetical protein BC332_34793 [Capsicum chinense]|nr:hypothetical protein BC332_34793 [Capsicum chinense]
MVQSKVLKQLSILEQHKLDDEDIVEDVQFLNEKLQASVQDLRYLVIPKLSSAKNGGKKYYRVKEVCCRSHQPSPKLL